jgi:hypothetical protein
VSNGATGQQSNVKKDEARKKRERSEKEARKKRERSEKEARKKRE